MLRTGKTLKNGGFPPFFYLFPFYLINFSRKTTFREKIIKSFIPNRRFYSVCTFAAQYQQTTFLAKPPKDVSL